MYYHKHDHSHSHEHGPTTVIDTISTISFDDCEIEGTCIATKKNPSSSSSPPLFPPCIPLLLKKRSRSYYSYVDDAETNDYYADAGRDIESIIHLARCTNSDTFKKVDDDMEDASLQGQGQGQGQVHDQGFPVQVTTTKASTEVDAGVDVDPDMDMDMNMNTNIPIPVSIRLHVPKPVYPHKSIEGKRMYMDYLRQAYDSWNISYNHRAVTAAFDASAAAAATSAATSASAPTQQGKGDAGTSSVTTRPFDRLFIYRQENNFTAVDATSSTCTTTAPAAPAAPAPAAPTTPTTVVASTPTGAKKTNDNFTPTTSHGYRTPILKKRKHSYASMSSSSSRDEDRSDTKVDPIDSDSFLESYLRGPPPLRRRKVEDLWCL